MEEILRISKEMMYHVSSRSFVAIKVSITLRNELVVLVRS